MPSGLIKPTLTTRFHIDYGWWEQNSQDLKSEIAKMCEEIDIVLPVSRAPGELLDWVNPRTGQVLQVDNSDYVFLSQCTTHPEYITERLSLIDAVFRALLGAGNQPMTPIALAEVTGRDAKVILQTLSGRTVYKGIRPYVLQSSS